MLEQKEQTFEQEMTEKTAAIENMLEKYLVKEPGLWKTVQEAANYSLKAGGKRLRPLFLIECSQALSGRGLCDPLVCAFAAALEMIHTYSLVHDDLPAMDNDRYRRGMLTTHAKYGEAMGILAGDALLNLAFETAANALVQETDHKRLADGAKALFVLSKKAGIYGMIGGQSVDVEKTGSPVTKEELDFIYRLKTGALLEAAMMTGGILAGASEETICLLERTAAAVGMAFQIQDDILDVTSSLEVLGKPVHSDERNKKSTYVALYSMQQAVERVEALSQEAAGLLENLPGDTRFLRQLILSLIHRKK